MKPLIQTMAFVVCVIFLFILPGCEDKETKEARLKIESLEKEVATLSALLEDANKKMEALGVNDRLTRDDCGEIKIWADSVVKSFGQGVWYPGETAYPVFVKPVKSGGVEKMIEELNGKFQADKLPEVLYLGAEKGRVQVGVSDDSQLTSRMGSAGAISYMNAVTFTLASVPGINQVEFKFEEGDHASPGTYSRSFVKP
jgi:hypothetical protein